jgi:lipopolysaccharide export system protein LptA
MNGISSIEASVLLLSFSSILTCFYAGIFQTSQRSNRDRRLNTPNKDIKTRTERRRRTVAHLWLTLFCVAYFVQGHAQIDTLSQDTIRMSAEQSSSGVDEPVVYEADDSVKLLVREKKVLLFGNAVVEYGDMKLEAGYIEVDFESKDIFARGIEDSTGKIVGIPIFTSEGKSYEAQEMTYNFETKKGLSSGVVTTEDDGIVRGEKFLKDSMDNIYVRNASYTTCNSKDPHFWIQSSKFKIVPNKQVVSGPANLVIAGVNTPLVVPFGFFPLNTNRSKGIILGNQGETNDRGFFIRDFGYYLPVNDFLDLTLTGDFYFNTSYGFSVQSRYIKRYRYNGSFSFKYNKNKFGEPESPDFRVSNDYNLTWRYTRDAKAKPGRSFSANVNYVSRNQLRNNSNEINDIVSTNANSSVNYSRSFFNNKLNLVSSARLNQNLSTGDLDFRLPDVNLNLRPLQPFEKLKGDKNKLQILRNLGVGYQSTLVNSLSINQDNIFDRTGNTLRLTEDVSKNLQNGMRHSIPINTKFNLFKYFNFSPRADLTEYWYLKSIEKNWTGTELVTDTVNGFRRAHGIRTALNVNTTIYGTKVFKRESSKIYAFRHVVRPNLSVSWSPDYQASERFGYRTVQADAEGNETTYSIFQGGVVGGPTGSANASVNLGVNNSLEAKIRSKRDTTNGGIKKVRVLDNLGINTSYNMLADSLNLSDITFNGSTSLFNKIRMSFSGRVDPYQFGLDTALNTNVKVNRFMLQDGKLARLTNARMSINTNLNPEALKRKENANANQDELAYINQYSQYFVDFSIPWSLNLNYSLTYNKRFDEEATVDQSITFNGDVNLSENWKIGFSSGYNFTRKETTITKIDFFRDLHCWEFQFGWIPVGTFRQFDFTIRVKSATLQDLKLNRRGFWFDN